MSTEPTFTDLIDLAAENLGGSALLANDEFFAEKENLLRSHPAEWREHAYTDKGKWMDGWETRRRREPGHDWCVVRLGLPGVIRGFVVDTAFFRGNFPSECLIEGASIGTHLDLAAAVDPATRWTTLVPRSALKGDSKNLFAVAGDERITHVRLTIFPDGGVARLRVHGEPRPDWRRLLGLGGPIDLAALENGAKSVVCSDMFFGSRHNLILPGKPPNMGGGWETRRRRGPGHDWNIVELAAPGSVRRVEVDTMFFKGNAPGRCSIDACDAPGAGAKALAEGNVGWRVLLPESKTQPHTRHVFDSELRATGKVTHVRLNVFPDGGVARLRCWGEPAIRDQRQEAIERINHTVREEALPLLRAVNGSSRWAERMVHARPFEDVSAIQRQAERVWWSLSEQDWLEAFAAHPRIGQKPADKLANGSADQHAAWSEKEQSGAAGAGADTTAELAALNEAYASKHGFSFIVCATGKSAAEMLELLRKRLQRSRAEELRTAAEEQAKITRLRIEKWLKQA